MVECPLCEAPLDVDVEELDEGDSLVCEECGVSLRVTGLHPLELEEEEDDFDLIGEEDITKDDPWRRVGGY